MVEAKIDELIEQVEVLHNEITKINFNIDGFKEESDKLLETRPFMVRQIQQNEKKMIKLLKNLQGKMAIKDDLDTRLNVVRMKHQEKLKKQEETQVPEKKTIKKTKTK